MVDFSLIIDNQLRYLLLYKKAINILFNAFLEDMAKKIIFWWKTIDLNKQEKTF
jgi:hypothetical protein